MEFDLHQPVEVRFVDLLERAADGDARIVDEEIDPPVLDTLRLGVHQLLGMRVASHAAASETVSLARSVNGAGAAGFVNAVLRRVVTKTLELPDQIAFQPVETQALAITKRLDLSKLKDSKFVDNFTRRYLIASADTGVSSGSDLLTLAARSRSFVV